MSEVISKAAKVAFFVVLCATLAVFVSSILATFNELSSGVNFSDIPVEIADAFITGRRVANNFIFPKVFNACITLWFTGSAALIGNYAVHAIGSKIAGINS